MGKTLVMEAAPRGAAASCRRPRIRWTVIDVAEGWIGLAATPRGLCASTLPCFTGGEARSALARALHAAPADIDPQPAGALAPEWQESLRAYFLGRRVDFLDALLDLRRATPFQQVVWYACRQVGYGSQCTYGELATRLGHPEAARAVGQALAANPLPIIVPCHRVVGCDHRLVGYNGGLDWKQWLLCWEESFGGRQ